MSTFIDLNKPTGTPPTPAQQWATDTQSQSARVWSDFFNFVQSKYNEIWGQKDTNPQDVVDKIAAFGTGAQAAFALHAAAVTYLAAGLPYIAGADTLGVILAGLTVPTGWTISFNPDGSAVVTPPQA
jgi:hypothetical protein